MPPVNQKAKLAGFLTLFLGLSWVVTRVGPAQILVPVQEQNRVDVIVSTEVEFDPATNLYTYNYQVTSSSQSEQEVASFSIQADAEILNAQSPQGWSAQQFLDKPILDWTATELEPLPPDFVDDGNIPPSPFNIKPGETLGGFSFQSPEPPTTVTFFAQGYAPLPSAVSEDDFDEVDIPDPLENSLMGSATGPGLDEEIIFTGGRRPSVDGFLGFVGVTDRQTLSRPVVITLRLAVNGEDVNPATFTASLNRVDVTQTFQPSGRPNELIGIFDLGSSPLEIGRNALSTSIEGIVPETTRTGVDTDRFTFFIES